MFQKQIKIEAFFAYRLPHESEAHYLKGEARAIASLKEAGSKGILIHSFLGDSIYQIESPEQILPENFTWSLNSPNGEITWNESEYLVAFKKIQAELNSGQFQKLILSRIKEIKTEKNALVIFHELNHLYKNTFNYLFSSPETGTWIGATPELLLNSVNKLVSTVSIAGTKPNDGFSEWTKKEREEQKMVTDFILDSFKKNKIQNVITGETSTLKAGPVEHLKTDISGKVENQAQVFDLLKDLHPTPATCGIPQAQSRLKIPQIEAHARKFYTGFIGMMDSDKKIFFVNLRCMELQENRALLFVGGGITKSSIGEREWIETEKKAETLKRVL